MITIIVYPISVNNIINYIISSGTPS